MYPHSLAIRDDILYVDVFGDNGMQFNGELAIDMGLSIRESRAKMEWGDGTPLPVHGETTVTIRGIDEADNTQGQVSWVSPVAQALLKARVGDEVRVMTIGSTRELCGGTHVHRAGDIGHHRTHRRDHADHDRTARQAAHRLCVGPHAACWRG